MVEHSILKLFLNNQEHYDKYYKTLKLEFIKTDYLNYLNLYPLIAQKNLRLNI
jgi:hypothetical protein